MILMKKLFDLEFMVSWELVDKEGVGFFIRLLWKKGDVFILLMGEYIICDRLLFEFFEKDDICWEYFVEMCYKKDFIIFCWNLLWLGIGRYLNYLVEVVRDDEVVRVKI